MLDLPALQSGAPLDLRVKNYSQKMGEMGRSWPPAVTYGDPPKLMGNWDIGNCYENTSDLYGAYPNSFLQRVEAMWPELDNPHFESLHLFSGGLECKHAWTLDASPDAPADIQGDAEQLGELMSDHKPMDVIMADPPYSKDQAADHYGGRYCNKRLVVRECSKVMKVGGYLLWLDTSMPIWAKVDGWRWGGYISVFTGTNRRLRGLFVLQKIRESERREKE